MAESKYFILLFCCTLPVPGPRRDPSILTHPGAQPTVERCICAWACAYLQYHIPHITLLPPSHNATVPRRLLLYIRVKSTSAKPAPAPPHLPSHKTGLASPCHFLTGVETLPHTKLRAIQQSNATPSVQHAISRSIQNIVTMRGSAWIKSDPGPIAVPPLARVSSL